MTMWSITDPCESSPCPKDNSICVDLGRTYECRCKPGFHKVENICEGNDY